jgi:prefoldin subunit 5
MGNYEDALDRIEQKVSDLDYFFTKTEVHEKTQKDIRDLKNMIYQLNQKIEALERNSLT